MTEHEKKIIAPDWNEQFTFLSVDDFMTSVETSQERTALALEELLNDFHRAEWDQETELRFSMEYHRYRVLVDLAFVHNDEITDHLKRWQVICENYKQERERQRKQTQSTELTLKQRIDRLLSDLNENSPKDEDTLQAILEAIDRLIVGWRVWEYRLEKK